MNNLDAALDYASRGFAVFPCAPDSKRPACANGVNDATTDEIQIRKWWESDPSFNIAVSPDRSGCFVLDEDPPLGAETLASLEMEHGLLPRTLTFQTPRGGFHYWFRGSCASSVGTDRAGLGPKLDTRGQGGYVVMAPSTVDGKPYTQLNELEIADAPGWIAAAVARRKERHENAGVETDLDSNIARAETWCRNAVAVGDVAYEGSGGNDRTYRAACTLRDFGLSAQRVLEVLSGSWNPHCVPPWQTDALEEIVEHACEYAQNETGAWAVAPIAETYRSFVESCQWLHDTQADNSSPSRFRPLALTETDAFKEPTWILPGLIPAQGTVQITGKQKSFKTFLALDMALGIATGVKTFGQVPASAPVVYVAGENASAIALKHVPAWRLAHGQENELPFWIVPNMPRANLDTEINELIKEVRKAHILPAVVVIDTATRALRGLDENSAKDMGLFSAACEHIQRELGCTVIVIRHTGKDESRGGRGSNVIEGDFDTMLSVERHEKSMLVAMTVKEQRNAAEREEPFTFEGTVVGPSLVFHEISQDAYRRATRSEDVYEPARVGTTLRGLKAFTEASAVTTHALAATLAPIAQGDTAEDHAAAVRRTEKALKALARGRLGGYVEGAGPTLRWFLPVD